MNNKVFKIKSIENFYSLSFLNTYMIGHKGFIAGGCFKNIFNKEKVKDIDIFFNNKEDFYEAVIYYEKHEDFKEYYKNKKVEAFKHTPTGTIVELIKSTFGSAEKVISEFDFSITKFAYFKEYKEDQSVDYKIIHHEDFFEHLHTKRLVVQSDIKYPVGTFERMIRYVGYGYAPCRESKVNILSSIHSLKDFSESELSKDLYKGLD